MLQRNVERMGVSGRIAISEFAVAGTTGSAEIFECEDAAYSTIGADRRCACARGIWCRRVLSTTSSNETLSSACTLSKSTSKAKICGAARRGGLLKRDAPFLLIEVGDESAGSGDTIDRLEAAGYSPYIVADGIVTPRREHDRKAANYFFVPSANGFVPTTDASIAREEAAYQQAILRRNRRHIVDIRATLREKNDEVSALKATIDRLTESLAAEQRRAQSQQAALATANARVAELGVVV